jgi:hypothetical protein
MTSTRASGPADINQAPADLPPLPIAALMIGAYNLLCEGADLPQPCHIAASETAQQINLQFPGKQPSRRAITAWAHRFGSVVTQHPHHDQRGQFTRVVATFGYYGLTVKAYAYIPHPAARI